MKILDLNGKWTFHEVGRGKWYPAEVPGSNYLDLLANNMIEHPYYACNEELTQWIGERDWEYAREFTLSAEMLKKSIIMLEAERLDTLADIYINDRLVARVENAFLSYKIDIKNFVSRLTNKIRIKFRSPIAYIEKKMEDKPLIGNKIGLTGAAYVRKPAMHFGWDNNLSAPFSGICGNIRIVGYDDAYLDECIVSEEYDVADIAKILCKQKVKGKLAEIADDLMLKMTVTEPNTNVITATLVKVDENNELMAAINNPQQWTTYNKQSKPALYNIKIELFNKGELIDSKSFKYGLRKVELKIEKDDFGKKFDIHLNEEKVFVKGVTLMPLDSMSSLFNKNKMKSYLDSIEQANINLIRVFAGGGYMPDEFYSMCDERGILVWQDMPFVGFQYPLDSKEFATNIEKEVRQNVIKLHTHPSCILLCGSYELEHSASRWYGKNKIKRSIFEGFYKKIPEIIQKITNNMLYIPSTPISAKFADRVNNDKAGTANLWYVWGGMRSMQKIDKHTPRFCTEFGMPSMPNMKTVDKFLAKKQANIMDIEFEKRQKYRDGNNKMLYYISSRFRVPRSMEDLIYYSELTQAEYYTEMVEHLRLNMQRCSGVIMTSLNDPWAGIDCSCIDYLGNYKAVMYKAKRFFDPLLMTIVYKKGTAKICVSADANLAFYGKIQWRIETFEGEVVAQDEKLCEIKSFATSELAIENIKEFVRSKERECVFIAELYDERRHLVRRENILFTQNKIALLPDPQFIINVNVQKSVAKIAIQAKRFARYVKVELDGNFLPFSDNYFDMCAGEIKEVSIRIGKNTKAEDIMQRLSVKSVANIDSKGNVLRDITKNAGVLMSPKNILDTLKHFVLR